MKRIKVFIKIMYICMIMMGISLVSMATSTATVYLTTNKSVLEVGEDIEVSLHIKNQKTAAYQADLYFDNTKLEYVSGPENTNIIDNHIIVVWHDPQGGVAAKEGELDKFVFKAKENGLANFVVNGEFYNQMGQSIQMEYQQTQAQIGKEETILEKQAKEEQGTDTQSKNANLQTLRIQQEGVIPNFEKDIYHYYLTVTNDIQDIEVLAISENPSAKVQVNGNTNLKPGLNAVTVKVTSQDGTQSQVYTLEVTKTANLELANTNLEVLAIENALLNPPFDNTVTRYDTQIANNITTPNILAVPENEKASVQITGKDNLQEGNNQVKITVTAPNGFTKREYDVNVYKRNQNEEQVYMEQQKLNDEKFKEAYDIEKVSTSTTDNPVTQGQQEEQDVQNKNLVIGVVVTAIIVAAGVLGFRYYKKNKEKRI